MSYPLWFEPALTRQTQASLWAWGFGAFALLCGACGWRVWRTLPGSMHPGVAEGPLRPAPPPSEGERMPEGRGLAGSGEPSAPERPATVLDKTLWFGLPLCGSVLLLATTNKLCQDVAVVPFLWVLPLSLYLLTFIICFDSPRWYVRKWFHLLLVPLLALLCYALFRTWHLPLLPQLAIYCGTLFVACMVCHGETYRLRPGPRFLTGFYLLIAAGGAAGGVFVAVLAPRIFRSYGELNWGMWLLGALLVLQYKSGSKPPGGFGAGHGWSGRWPWRASWAWE